MTNLELYDTTLRDGEQAAGARFTSNSRFTLFKELDDFGVDYIELGWPTDKKMLKTFYRCRKVRKKAKIVAFGSTSKADKASEDKNLKYLVASNADYACIFGKTDLDHVKKQLNISPSKNLEKIADSVNFLIKSGMGVFYDAEHYFDAYKSNPNYALKTLVSAISAGAERVILCDTNGGTFPHEAKRIVAQTKKKLEKIFGKDYVKLGVHFHNDRDLAVANALETADQVVQVQGTINGMGERVGNLNLSSFIPNYQDRFNKKLDVKLNRIKKVNEDAFRLGLLDVPASRAFVGETAFGHKGGVHSDALNKGASYEAFNPNDFGNRRIVLLNTLGGVACIVAVANQFGREIDKRDEQVQEKVRAIFKELAPLEHKGYRLEALAAEQYMIIEKYFGNYHDFFNIRSWKTKSSYCNKKELSEFYVDLNFEKQKIKSSISVPGGQVDAAYKTLVGLISKKYPAINELKIVDYSVGIAKSMGEESAVRTQIVFEGKERFTVVGVDRNQTQSAVEALTKGFNYYLNRRYSTHSKLNK